MTEPQMFRKSGPPRSIRFWLGYVVLVIGFLGLMIALIWATQSDLP
jgi:hypothetical protein